MSDTQNAVILQQIRVLLDQLEISQNKTTKAEVGNQKEDIMKRMLQVSCDRYWMYDPTTKSVDIFVYNHETHREVKISKSLASLKSFVSDSDQKKIDEVFAVMLTTPEVTKEFEYGEYKDEHCIVYSVHALACEIGSNLKIIGTTHIITEFQQSLQQMLQAQQKYEILLGMSNMYVWEYDVKKKIFSANRTLCEKLGINEKSYTMEELDKLVHISEMSKFLDWIEKKGEQEKALVHIQTKKSSFELTFETAFQSIRDEHGNLLLLLGIMMDITEHELLKTMASKDTLTGCYNRNMADVTLESSFKNFVDTGEFYTIIFFDIDKFKTVNDRYGHDMGDYVLTSVCERISTEIRNNDMIFRWGGDEFLLICRGLSKENIYGYIDRLRKNIEVSIFEFNGVKLQLTISIGAAIFYKSDSDYSAAMKRADRSLYKAKLAGRNKVCILN